MVAGVGATLVATGVLGFAHLVQPSVPFPPLGLAQRALHLIPGRLAVVFIELLGHWALRLFVVGVLLTSLAAGGLAGMWVAARPPAARARAAWLAGGALALLALLGYQDEPGAPSLAVFGVLVAIAGAAYVLVLRGALGRLERDPVPAPARGLGRTRREFLRAAAGAGALLVAGAAFRKVSGGLGADGGSKPLLRPAGAAPVAPAPVPPESAAEQAVFAIKGLSPEVTPNHRHYTVDESIIDPSVDAGSWRLRIDGLVSEPVELTYQELLGMAAFDQFVTLQCVSNEVGGDLVGTARWTGVPLRDVLAKAGTLGQGAVRVAFHAVGGYTDSLPVDEALAPTTMVAYGMNGVSLPRAHGYPARIIVPGIYGMKNVKWLRRIQVVDYDFEGYWQRSAGWDNVAEIKTASRIDVPASEDMVRGELTVAGVAWAGERQIRTVEVSVDGGRTWRPATLRRELAKAAWRQWRLSFRPGREGELRLLVRAVDGTGTVQAETKAPPYPSGSSGYDEARVRALPGG
jgi:DMSO/TMAO reductase YedYZ molybdopterin-dependent catalytic subunit